MQYTELKFDTKVLVRRSDLLEDIAVDPAVVERAAKAIEKHFECVMVGFNLATVARKSLHGSQRSKKAVQVVSEVGTVDDSLPDLPASLGGLSAPRVCRGI